MDLMEIFRGNFSHVDIGPCVLHLLSQGDRLFMHSLFAIPDVRKYYVLRDDHARDIDLLLDYDLSTFSRCGGFTYVITTKQGQKAGIISVEFSQEDGRLIGNTSYALLPQYRGNGYATAALTMLGVFMTGSQADELVLDISMDNEASMNVARAANYQTDRVGYMDWEHPEVGMRKKWRYSLSAPRIINFRKAQEYHQRKEYTSAISFWKKALDCDYPQGTPFTDAQIISNLGMEYSSNKEYRKAYECLTKAQQMGLDHPSIIKEINWLLEHRYLW